MAAPGRIPKTARPLLCMHVCSALAATRSLPLPQYSDAAPCTALTSRRRRDPTHPHNRKRITKTTMAVFSRITLLAGTAARCVHAMNRRGLAMANPTATFKTTKGEFKVELFQDQLPITTSNFKDLATS